VTVFLTPHIVRAWCGNWGCSKNFSNPSATAFAAGAETKTTSLQVLADAEKSAEF
jgi:hypothetical protein